MFIGYIVVMLLTDGVNIFSATLDFIRFKQVLVNMAKANVSESWITTLGLLKGAGALGLLIGIGVPLIGIASATGLVVFLSALSSLICVHAIILSVLRLFFYCWPSRPGVAASVVVRNLEISYIS